uniref:TPX2 central domain-containing protein n=1 Tax=Daucus carota subsp. sativus TaxID=79200 RepID=A0A166E1B5_DAUCS
MDEEMEETVMYTFTAIEIDLDYEFDAARFFDFSRQESVDETLQAELWFQSRPSYPPSPFVKKPVLRENVLPDNVTASSKFEGFENMDFTESDSDLGGDMEILRMDMSREECGGVNRKTSIELNGCTQLISDQCSNIPAGCEVLPFVFLHYGLQNFVLVNRYLKLENYKSIVPKISPLESQPAKRQKLEGGQLCKFADTHQQTHLVHKEPKKDIKPDKSLAHAKLRLTIPKEPAFETAQRAQRMRSKVRDDEQLTSTAPKFRARPLNRKMLEAPSMLLPKRSIPRKPEFQEFYLKTSERAMQHNVPSSSAHSSKPKVLHHSVAGSIADCSNKDIKRWHVINTPKKEGCELVHKFKALPPNKKIFSSKADIRVSRNNKKDSTLPTLTLTAEIQPSTGPRINLPRPTCTLSKIKKPSQGKATCLKAKQISAHTGVTKIGLPSNMSRSSSVH